MPKRGRRPMLINSQRLVDAGHAIMDDANRQFEEAETTLSAKRLQAIALLYRNGLLVSLAAFLAYRRRNLAGLFIGTTLRLIKEVWIVDIPGGEVKNGQALLSEFPPDLSELTPLFPLIGRSLLGAVPIQGYGPPPRGGLPMAERFTSHFARRCERVLVCQFDFMMSEASASRLGES